MPAFKLIALALVAVGALSAAAAGAQTAPSAPVVSAARDPADPKAAVPAVNYSSAFKRYRPNVEVEVGGWRDLNDHVGRVGGWRVYGREASPEAAAPISGKPEGAAAPPAHGHKH
jgi:hypothetical protein